MDSSSLQASFALAPVPTAHVYSASDFGIDSMQAMMGYSRVGSQSLLRALRTWTLEVLPTPVRPVCHRSGCLAIWVDGLFTR